MKSVITLAAVLLLSGAAVAQTPSTGTGSRTGAGTSNPSVPPALAPDQRVIGTAPVGHRQPRAVSSNSSAYDKIDPEDAELDRKIKGICRGC